MKSNNGYKRVGIGGFSNKKEQQFQINGMRGVDLTNSPLFVDKQRATAMSNFILENNVIQKRNGWIELLQHSEKQPINGVWYLDTSDNSNCTIVMMGKKFYSMNMEAMSKFENPNITELEMNFDTQYIKDEIAYGVVAGEKLYVLCGDFLTIGFYNGNLEVRQVENDEQTYIPTTTISIPAIGNTIIKRSSYDDINMLTKWRYNSLIGEKSDTTLESFKYILDAVSGSTNEVEVYVRDEKGNYQILNNDDSSAYSLYETTYENQNVTILELFKNYPPVIEGQDNILVKFTVPNYKYAEMIRKCKFGIRYGYNEKDRLFLSGNPDYPNLIFRSNESTSTDQEDFTYFSPVDFIKLGNSTNVVKGMTILGDGTLCALKNSNGQEPTIYFINPTMVTATDREGNPIYVDDVAQVEEQYQTKVGTIGEGLINTSSLQNLAGDTLMLSENGVFGIVLGSNVANSQRYAKTRSRLINGVLTKDRKKLEDAICFVHNNKYYMCIDDDCYIADGRYPYKNEDDVDGEYQYEWYVWNNIPARIFFTYQNQLFFGTNDGRFMTFTKDSYADVIYSSSFDGEITYADGSFIINKDRVKDLERLHNDDILHLNTIGSPIYALLLNKDEFEVDTEKNALRVLKKVSHEYITQMSSYIYYFDEIGSNANVELNKPYIMTVLEDIDETIDEDNDYTLLKFYEAVIEEDDTYVAGDEVDVTNGSFRVCYALNESNVVTDVHTIIEENDEERIIWYKDVVLNDDVFEIYLEDGNIERTYKKEDLVFNRFKIKTYTSEEKTHDIIFYNGTAYRQITGYFEFIQPVSCLYVTPIFNLGSNIYSKNINQMIIVPDAVLDTEVEFGYETKTNVKYFSAFTGTKFDFNNIDFDNFSFDTEGFATAFIKRTRLKNVNFIRFIFKNSSKNNCKISNLTVVYEYGKKNKGVA
jgi:hypothetical protein